VTSIHGRWETSHKFSCRAAPHDIPPITHRVPLLTGIICVPHQNNECNNLKPSSRIFHQFANVVSVNAVVKVAEETALMICGACCVIIAWLLIRGVLPDTRTILGALGAGLLGSLFLFCAQMVYL